MTPTHPNPFTNPRETQETLQRVVQAVRDGLLWRDACAGEQVDPEEGMGRLMELRALHALPMNPFERRRDPFAKRTPGELSMLVKNVHAYILRGGPLREALALGDVNLNLFKRGLAMLKLEFPGEEGAGVKKKPDAGGETPKAPRKKREPAEILALFERAAQFHAQGHNADEAAKLAGTSYFMLHNYRKKLLVMGITPPVWAPPRQTAGDKPFIKAGKKQLAVEDILNLLTRFAEFRGEGHNTAEAAKLAGCPLCSVYYYRRRLSEMGIAPPMETSIRGNRDDIIASFKTIHGHVRGGMTLTGACEAAGLPLNTFINWRRKMEPEFEQMGLPLLVSAKRTPRISREEAAKTLDTLLILMNGGLTLAEACKKTGCPESGVKTRVERLGRNPADYCIRPPRKGKKAREAAGARAVQDFHDGAQPAPFQQPGQPGDPQ